MKKVIGRLLVSNYTTNMVSFNGASPTGGNGITKPKSGDIVRIGPNEVIVSNPEAIKVIYGLRTGFVKVG